jgi:hypothetical protein
MTSGLIVQPTGRTILDTPRSATDRARRVAIVAVPLVLAVVLCWHPAGGADVYEGVRADATAWLVVHTVFLLCIPLIGIAAFLLLRGIERPAATVSRVAIAAFLVFYTAYEASVGIGTGILVDYANGLSDADQAVVADAIQHYNRSAVVGDPASLSLLIGVLGWTVAMVSAALALHREGAGRLVTGLVGASALFAVHPPPIGSVGLVCFALAAGLVERRTTRDRTRP